MKKIAKITFGACVGQKRIHFLCRGPVLSSFKVQKVILSIYIIYINIYNFKRSFNRWQKRSDRTGGSKVMLYASKIAKINQDLKS